MKHECKHQIGDRVIWISYKVPYEGVGGTVAAIQKLPNAGGIFGGPTFYVRVILDTAEIIEDEAGQFVTVNDYKNQSYIPF